VATLALYRDPPRALRDVPTLAMLTTPPASLRARAERLSAALVVRGVAAEVVASEASVGGGAFPSARIPSFAVALGGDAPALERRLRAAPRPVVARIAEGRVMLDVRSVPAADDVAFAAAVADAIG